MHYPLKVDLQKLQLKGISKFPRGSLISNTLKIRALCVLFELLVCLLQPVTASTKMSQNTLAGLPTICFGS